MSIRDAINQVETAIALLDSVRPIAEDFDQTVVPGPLLRSIRRRLELACSLAASEFTPKEEVQVPRPRPKAADL